MRSAEFERGKLTFDSGNYRAAFHQLLPVAYEGDCRAQYAIGYMYFYGLTVATDNESGLFWIDKSAKKGYPPAIKALGLIHQHNQFLREVVLKPTQAH